MNKCREARATRSAILFRITSFYQFQDTLTRNIMTFCALIFNLNVHDISGQSGKQSLVLVAINAMGAISLQRDILVFVAVMQVRKAKVKNVKKKTTKPSQLLVRCTHVCMYQ